MEWTEWNWWMNGLNGIDEWMDWMILLTFVILILDGAPGKPGRHVLKADISLHGPLPHMLIPATRNLYAVPGSRRCFVVPFGTATADDDPDSVWDTSWCNETKKTWRTPSTFKFSTSKINFARPKVVLFTFTYFPLDRKGIFLQNFKLKINWHRKNYCWTPKSPKMCGFAKVSLPSPGPRQHPLTRHC